jgi:hypothetical protein
MFPIPVLAALIGASLGAMLAASFVYLNTEIQKKRKRSDLYRLLRAEILNMKRHCSVTSREVCQYSSTDIGAIRTMKYKDGGTLFLDTKELYLLNENICQDIMQLSLLSRNNDIFVEELLEFLRKDRVDLKEFVQKIEKIKKRMEGLDGLCGAVLDNLDKFAQNPNRYNEPVIDW